MISTALQELHDIETAYWWHVGRLSIIEKQLEQITKNFNNPTILNVGSGTGGTIPTIEKFGKIINIDTSQEALNFLKLSGHKGILVKGNKLPFKDGSFDIVTSLDVLEHIKNDNLALEEWLRVLKPDGTLLLTVPSYQWLWSQHDVINNHYRRYTQKVLSSQLNNAGFEVAKASYAIVFSFPLVVLSRGIDRLSRKSIDNYSTFTKLPGPINSLFVLLLKCEAIIQKYINLPFGTSLLYVCRK